MTQRGQIVPKVGTTNTNDPLDFTTAFAHNCSTTGDVEDVLLPLALSFTAGPCVYDLNGVLLSRTTLSFEPFNDPVRPFSDPFAGSNNGGGNGGGSDTTPNDFDGTSGDAPMPPQKVVNNQGDQAPGGYSSSSPNGGVDPTNPTNGGCGDDYDYRPNPEEYKDYGSLSTVNLKELTGSNEMNLMLDSMSVDTMGM